MSTGAAQQHTIPLVGVSDGEALPLLVAPPVHAGEGEGGTYWTWRRVVRALWTFLVLPVTLCLVPLIIWQLAESGTKAEYVGYLVGGIFVLLSLPISFYSIGQHLVNFSKPRVQRHVVRILWMVPIYSINSWLALRLSGASLYLDTARECYEAYVIYSFFYYLVSYVEDATGHGVVAVLAAKQRSSCAHVWPVDKFLEPWAPGEEFYERARNGVLNYVVIRPFCTAAVFLMQAMGVYDEGNLDPRKGYVWTSLITNFSQMWSLYCLVLLYYALHDELAPVHPVSKFLSVKFVVFFTWWQGLVLSVLSHAGILNAGRWTTYDSGDIAAGLQDFMICVEMFFFALWHAAAFPSRDYRDPTLAPRSFGQNLRDMFAVGDVVADVSRAPKLAVEGAGTAAGAAGRMLYAGAAAIPGAAAAGASTLAQQVTRASRSKDPRAQALVGDGDFEIDAAPDAADARI